MKKALLVSVLSFFFSISFSQSALPSYPEVLRQFFTHYQGIDEYDNYTSFSKKEKGWYVQQVNRIKNDSMLTEHLFWSVATKKYINLSADYTPQPTEEAEKKIAEFLSDIAFYSFERCRYYGYDNWNTDMIKDFGGKENLSDTMLEGLSRAYSSYANTYLWYQAGGREIKSDTLHRMLGRLELPSDERIKQVIYNVAKDIETLQQLEKRNPRYIALVGNVHLKVFNEHMFGYMQMMFARREKEARNFIEQIILDEPYKVQARNYLTSCDSNAVLFSFGDNDTYQLWYVQQKEGFRKDVTVLNYSLLGLPIYLELLKEKKMVNITTPTSFYKTAGGDVVYRMDNKNYTGSSPVTFAEVEKMIYDKKFPLENATYPTYPDILYSTFPPKEFTFPLGAKTGFLGKKVDKDSKITITAKDYMYMNDLLVLNIVAANSNSRPIYFTSSFEYFDNNLLVQGIVQKLAPSSFTADEAIKDAEAKGLENFLATKFHPVLSDEKILSYDGDNCFVFPHATLVYYYAERNKDAEAAAWLKKALAQLPPYDSDNLTRLEQLARPCIAAKDFINAKKFFEISARKAVDNYFNPHAGQTYRTKEELLDYLKNTINIFTENNMDISVMEGFIDKLNS